MYSVVLKATAAKELCKLPWKDQGRIRSAIDHLAEDPFFGKAMQGDCKGMFSIRVWPYRIIYTIQKNIVTVTVVAIGHRKDVYKKLPR